MPDSLSYRHFSSSFCRFFIFVFVHKVATSANNNKEKTIPPYISMFLSLSLSLLMEEGKNSCFATGDEEGKKK